MKTFLGATEEQMRAQYARNAKTLAGMAREARRRKPNRIGYQMLNGYTAAELEARAAVYQSFADGAKPWGSR